MKEILKYFSIETAKHKNKSFKYFIEKEVIRTSALPLSSLFLNNLLS